jgi:hypothetical protein
MNETSDEGPAVERLSAQTPVSISEELSKLLAMVRAHAPDDAKIGIDFDGKLHLRVDVRNGEHVKVLEEALPTLGTGDIFHRIEVGATPGHPFSHRVSALIDR